MHRSERLIRLTKWLLDRPNQPVSLSDLATHFDAAKSTLSEDIATIRSVLRADATGEVDSVQGAAGGVNYRVRVSPDEETRFFSAMERRLSDGSRILPGGFLYMSDVLGDPAVLDLAGRMFAQSFGEVGVNVVVTIETKGIPLAVATAHYLHVPVVVVRREHRVTEGAALSLHYVSGSERRIQTMSISKRAMPSNARALIVDDFMRAGATAKAVVNLLAEFDAGVVGTAVFMVTEEPAKKLVSDYTALFSVGTLEEGKQLRVVAQTGTVH